MIKRYKIGSGTKFKDINKMIGVDKFPQKGHCLHKWNLLINIYNEVFLVRKDSPNEYGVYKPHPKNGARVVLLTRKTTKKDAMIFVMLLNSILGRLVLGDYEEIF